MLFRSPPFFFCLFPLPLLFPFSFLSLPFFSLPWTSSFLPIPHPHLSPLLLRSTPSSSPPAPPLPSPPAAPSSPPPASPAFPLPPLPCSPPELALPAPMRLISPQRRRRPRPSGLDAAAPPPRPGLGRPLCQAGRPPLPLAGSPLPGSVTPPLPRPSAARTRRPRVHDLVPRHQDLPGAASRPSSSGPASALPPDELLPWPSSTPAR